MPRVSTMRYSLRSSTSASAGSLRITVERARLPWTRLRYHSGRVGLYCARLKVYNDPESVAAGHDSQLERAVEEELKLLREANIQPVTMPPIPKVSRRPVNFRLRDAS
jgi:hypothetical protein